jgi:hypothetical protein
MLLIRRWGDYPTPNLSMGLAVWSGLLSHQYSTPPYLEKKIWWFGKSPIALRAEGGYVYNSP